MKVLNLYAGIGGNYPINLNHHNMYQTTELLPHRTIHVQTLHSYGERNSLVRVLKAAYEEQAEVAKAKHREHFKVTADECIETILTPVNHNESELMRVHGVELK